jgi:uncharacterized protein YbjT (DUF2867 family)
MGKWISTALIYGLATLSVSAAGYAGQAGGDGQKPLVLVAGATGRTGKEVVKQLLARNYRVRGLVRDQAKAAEIFGSSVQYAVGDVREAATLPAAMKDVTYVISAIGSTRDDPANSAEQVDYGGVKNLADAAKAAGIRHFVLVSAMGVTRPEEVVPEGRPSRGRPGTSRWKLKGEDHLRASGLTYTVVRPGGLGDKPGGQQGITVEQGDKPIEGDPRARMIQRANLATVLANAMGNPDAYNKTFEVTGDLSTQSVDWDHFFKPLAKDKR